MTTLPPRHITFCTSNLPGTLQLNKTARCNRRCFLQIGAGNQVRTGDLYLGKVPLYQLSYSRRSYLLSNYASPLLQGAPILMGAHRESRKHSQQVSIKYLSRCFWSVFRRLPSIFNNFHGYRPLLPQQPALTATSPTPFYG